MAAFTESVADCTWGIGGIRIPFALAPGANVVLQPKRLDVDDVDDTSAPGTQFHGTWSVTARATGTLIHAGAARLTRLRSGPS